ncbi:hypothetical protein [Mycolicibacterium brumae]|uniref:3-hydroxyacyl-CoA dehydrogenase n=1 Tax=Mycolicibacterium brumae TaxID=85968 RepID=A0A2G5PB11_9MYCO|nr:hypothetical protein [Mycolicibacterium brumae]MCV7193280.1 hypothetical protein [Mycolicibacterium brumae]PIB75559.1 hypothetical protein CQY22_009070 [Mycolicibacterium brumae]RWA21075.1 hypothetical protein MBRU_15315 [Mycolicibacterium brumae DSM 44177]UWW09937.1 hypothetical protein L2Z93_003055 [Mycolicibacterium brumae]
MTELVALHLARKQILAAPTDGSPERVLVDGVDQCPDGVVVDRAAGHIYWTNMGAPDGPPAPGAEPTFLAANGSIERVDLDGSNRRTIVPAGGFTTGKQLTADFAAGKLYWCDREGMAVRRCNLDGSELEAVVVTGSGPDDAADARNHCVGIAVDTARGLLYWTQKGAPNAGQGRIFRCPIEIPDGQDAARRADVELLWDQLPEPIDLELLGDDLLWTDRGDPPAGNTLNRGVVQPVPGSHRVISGDYQEAIGLASADGERWYVSSLYSGRIREVNLTSGAERTVATLGGGVTGIAVLS